MWSLAETPFLLTPEDINSIYRVVNKTYKLADLTQVREKMETFKPDINHVIDCTLYNTVYATSDIHSDFRKFIQILKNNNIIKTEFDPYNGDEIYDPRLLTDFEWIAGSSVLIVFVGDLVDGARDHGEFYNSVDDKRGSFEFLLHAFIYNMRIKSNRVRSEVLFTIGNHD